MVIGVPDAGCPATWCAIACWLVLVLVLASVMVTHVPMGPRRFRRIAQRTKFAGEHLLIGVPAPHFHMRIWDPYARWPALGRLEQRVITRRTALKRRACSVGHAIRRPLKIQSACTVRNGLAQMADMGSVVLLASWGGDEPGRRSTYQYPWVGLIPVRGSK